MLPHTMACERKAECGRLTDSPQKYTGPNPWMGFAAVIKFEL